MKRILTSIAAVLASLSMTAQGWPANYEGVMLQAFYWDSYDDSQWTVLESQADELSKYFKLVWIPQSGNCGGTSMGYDDLYWFPGHYNSSFGTEKQLRSMISTFREKGIGTIADVVINHRKSSNGWFGFPSETWNGVTYKMTAADICADDDAGKAKTQADKQGVTLGNNDTGEGWDGMRDLDHTSENVQQTVKAYLHMLLEDMGYTGFRYDMVKGYSGEYTKQYNEDAKPQFSVGECWDGTGVIRNWIEATGKTSAAFDFQFRYTVRNAANNNNWLRLGQVNDNNWPLVSYRYRSGAYRQYAVTFVENHDTERRTNAEQDPLKKDTLAANAYLLAMPGTPCVFYTHWLDCKEDIKPMIDVRNYMGISNTSDYEQLESVADHYAVRTGGRKGNLVCCVGPGASTYTPDGSYTKILSGYHYAYWIESRLETAWIDRSSGDFSKPFDVTLTAVSLNSDARLVYTTDGSEPTATNGTQTTSGARLTISETTLLKVGLLVGGTVKGIVSREYTYKADPNVVEIPDFCTVADGEVCAFFEAPSNWQETIMCWAWSSVNYTGGKWPGVACTKLGTAKNGNTVWKWTFNEKDYKGSAGTATQPTQIIFSNGSDGKPQTNDYTFQNGGYYNQKGQQGQVTSGIGHVIADGDMQAPVYTIDGRKVGRRGSMDRLAKGLYIVDGRKVVVR